MRLIISVLLCGTVMGTDQETYFPTSVVHGRSPSGTSADDECGISSVNTSPKSRLLTPQPQPQHPDEMGRAFKLPMNEVDASQMVNLFILMPKNKSTGEIIVELTWLTHKRLQDLFKYYVEERYFSPNQILNILVEALPSTLVGDQNIIRFNSLIHFMNRTVHAYSLTGPVAETIFILAGLQPQGWDMMYGDWQKAMKERYVNIDTDTRNIIGRQIFDFSQRAQKKIRFFDDQLGWRMQYFFINFCPDSLKEYSDLARESRGYTRSEIVDGVLRTTTYDPTGEPPLEKVSIYNGNDGRVVWSAITSGRVSGYRESELRRALGMV